MVTKVLRVVLRQVGQKVGQVPSQVAGLVSYMQYLLDLRLRLWML